MRTQNLSDGRLPLWRHGRAWLAGLAIEWTIPGRRLGISIGFRGFSVQLPLVAAVFVTLRSAYDCSLSSLSIYWLDGCLWISHPFEREGGMEWRSSDPWWRKAICLHVVDWILGRQRYERTTGEKFQVVVPMPEGCYLAMATPERCVWRRRWYVPVKVRESVWLEIPGGIPHAGKGENGWDCGDDGLCGIGGKNTEDAIANAVRSSLKDRRRYGLASSGAGGAPVAVLNAAYSSAESESAFHTGDPGDEVAR